MLNRIALATILLSLSAPSWSDTNNAYRQNSALQQVRGIEQGKMGTYDGGCTGGSCGAQGTVCEGESCRIQRATNGALTTGGLSVAQDYGGVPAPELGDDAEGSKGKPGFFSKLFSGKGLKFGLGGAAVGAVIGWMVGGPFGALIGGLIGAVGGFLLSKFLAK